MNHGQRENTIVMNTEGIGAIQFPHSPSGREFMVVEIIVTILKRIQIERITK